MARSSFVFALPKGGHTEKGPVPGTASAQQGPFRPDRGPTRRLLRVLEEAEGPVLAADRVGVCLCSTVFFWRYEKITGIVHGRSL